MKILAGFVALILVGTLFGIGIVNLAGLDNPKAVVEPVVEVTVAEIVERLESLERPDRGDSFTPVQTPRWHLVSIALLETAKTVDYLDALTGKQFQTCDMMRTLADTMTPADLNFFTGFAVPCWALVMEE